MFLVDILRYLTSTNVAVQAYTKFIDDRQSRSAIFERLASNADVRSSLGATDDDWRRLSERWGSMATLTRHWQHRLDASLPGRLGVIGKWLHQVERLIDTEATPGADNAGTSAAIRQHVQQLQVI